MKNAEMAQLEEALTPEERKADVTATAASTARRTRVLTTANAILDVVRTRGRLRAAWMERLWSEGMTSADQGQAISSGEVKRILSDPNQEAAAYASFVAKGVPADLAKNVREADDALQNNGFFEHMTVLFGLNKAEQDLLVLLIAVELNPKLERVLAYLADDTRATRPTMWITAELFGGGELSVHPATLMRSLLQWRLAMPVEGEQPWQAKSAWNLDEAVLASVRAERWVEPSLEGAVRWIGPDDTKSLPCLYQELLEEMISEIGPSVAHTEQSAGTGNREFVDVALVGPDGAGRETLAAQFASAMNAPLISVDTQKLNTGSDNARDAMVRAVRLARTSAGVLYLREAEAASVKDWPGIRDLAGLCLRGVKQEANGVQQENVATHRYMLQPLDKAKRLGLWALYSGEPVLQLVAMQRLTPKEIKFAAEAGNDAAARVALRGTVSTRSELLQALPCPYTWDDLVLPTELKRTLTSFESEVRLRWDVYEDWGFARLTHLGQGISALFSGPSGTGKTMAAQVLAHSLGMDLYRVDLAGVVNKYIGETEKRLRDVFDACERSGAVLFFDEADALFGSRMQVKDSHDRFANIEIDYLLQRIEQFDGIAILATNRKGDLDEAFLRRLRFVVDFLPPAKADRLVLWQKALPERAPSGELIRGTIDFALLANELDVNGAQVKSIILGAAFLAKQEGSRIGMAHIEQSAQREYAKHGMRLRLPIGSDLL